MLLIRGPRASLASRKPPKTYDHLDCGDLAFVVSLGGDGLGRLRKNCQITQNCLWG